MLLCDVQLLVVGVLWCTSHICTSHSCTSHSSIRCVCYVAYCKYVTCTIAHPPTHKCWCASVWLCGDRDRKISGRERGVCYVASHIFARHTVARHIVAYVVCVMLPTFWALLPGVDVLCSSTSTSRRIPYNWRHISYIMYYGVALVSRIDKIIGLFCKIAL